MKKVLLSVLVLFFATTVATYAQEVGQKWIGGSLNFSSSKAGGSDKRATDYSIMPEIGIQTAEKWGFGVALGYGHTEKVTSMTIENETVEATSKLNTFKIAPYARYVVYKNDIFSIFTDAAVGYSYGKNSDADLKINELEAGLRPGVKVNIVDNFAFFAKVGQLGYASRSEKVGDAKSVKSDSFGLNLNMDQFYFGLSYIF